MKNENKTGICIQNWINQSFVILKKIYSLGFFMILLLLYLSGWLIWSMRTYCENEIWISWTITLITFYFYGCLYNICIRSIRNGSVCSTPCFISFKKYLMYLLSEMILSFIFIAGLILFIVPGFFIALKFSMTRLVVLDQQKGLLHAFKKSYTLTSGHVVSLSILVLPVFLMWVISRFSAYSLSSIPSGDMNLLMTITSSILLIVSSFFILPLTCVALVLAYDFLSPIENEN